MNIDKNSPEYTICQKMSLTENKTIVQYLFDEGKCGKICRTGKPYTSVIFSSHLDKIDTIFVPFEVKLIVWYLRLQMSLCP